MKITALTQNVNKQRFGQANSVIDRFNSSKQSSKVSFTSSVEFQRELLEQGIQKATKNRLPSSVTRYLVDLIMPLDENLKKTYLRFLRTHKDNPLFQSLLDDASKVPRLEKEVKDLKTESETANSRARELAHTLHHQP